MVSEQLYKGNRVGPGESSWMSHVKARAEHFYRRTGDPSRACP